MTSEKENISKRTHPRGIRWFVIRLMTCCAVCLPLVLVEVGLRCFGPDPGMLVKDPLVSFGNLSPLFVLSASGSTYETDVDRVFYFCPQSFSAVKGEDTFRIFCLGGSTVQGRPYSVETSFSTWLKLNLESICPEKQIEMVNCGGISYASYRLIPIMDEILTYEPDLIVLCSGQNEFLEARTFSRLKRTPDVLLGLHQTLLRLRTYRLGHQWMTSRRERQAVVPVLSDEVQPTLDLEAGLTLYKRDIETREGVINEFAHNLEVLIQRAQKADVSLVLMNPVSNLRDCPPFKSAMSGSLPPETKGRVEALWAEARQSDDPWTRLDLLEQAVQLDGEHAGLLFQLASCYAETGQHAKAKAAFIEAKDQDICPLRMLEPMHEAVKDLAVRYRLTLVDIRQMIEQQSEHGIPGDAWLVNHVHPTINGHQLIADELTSVLVQKWAVQYPEQWGIHKKERWQTHLMSLDEGYYQEGFEHLMMLKTWTRERRGIKDLD